MEDVLVYIRDRWAPPPGDYSHRIAPPATRVIGFGTHNQGCGGENGTSEASRKKGTKLTPYSRHQYHKLRKIVTLHNWS